MADDTTSLDDVLAQLRAQYGDPTAPVVSDASTAPATDQAPLPSPYMVATATRESGNNPYAKNPSSSAQGTNQFLDGTFQDMVNRHPSANGPGQSYTDKNDPKLMSDYTQENVQALRLGLGRPPTSVEVYAAHFLGAAGAVKFLTAPPNTPVTQVVSPQAIASNHNVFFDKSGQPLTVGQVYANVSQNMGFKDTIPMNPQGGSPGTGGNGQTMPPAVPASAPAATTSPGDAVYGQQRQDIANYIGQQPAMWAKLTDLQNQYKQASAPTFMDRLSDAMSQFQQQQAVAQANQHATAGGVLLNALPSAKDFNQSLAASHTIDIDARAARLAQAQQAYQMGAGQIAAQNAQGATNLGLTGSLAKDTGEYNLAAAANALKLAQFGNEQATSLANYAEKMIPNAETRERVISQFSQNGGNPSGSLTANMGVIDRLAAQAQAGGAQISTKEPAKMFSIETYDPTANGGQGGQKLETVNAANPEGQARLKQVAQDNPNAKISDLAAPSTNVSVNPQGESAPGGAAGASLADQHLSAINTKQAAQGALQLLPFIEKHGGTGVLTDSPEGKTVASAIKQATGFDVTGLPVREVYDKLMSQVQSGLTLPGLKAFGGRPAASEFNILQRGQLGEQATTQAANAYLQHVIDTMDYTTGKIEAQSNAQNAARQQNNTFFDPVNWQIQFQKNNLPPAWNGQGLLDAVGGTPAQPPTDTSSPLLAPKQAQTAIDWMRQKLGLEPTAAGSAPVPPHSQRPMMPPLFPPQGDR